MRNCDNEKNSENQKISKLENEKFRKSENQTIGKRENVKMI